MPTVHIIEDEGLIALYLTEAMAIEGFTVSGIYASGEAFLERFPKEPFPDIVLMDILLAGRIDGIETARRLKEMANVPVIFVTASTQHLEDAPADSSCRYFQKPVDPAELVKNMREMLPEGR